MRKKRRVYCFCAFSKNVISAKVYKIKYKADAFSIDFDIYHKKFFRKSQLKFSFYANDFYYYFLNRYI